MKGSIDFFEMKGRLERFIRDNTAQLKKVGIISLLILAALVVYAVGGSGGGSEVSGESGGAEAETAGSTTIFVDIGGAVSKPMLAELPEGSRVEDAIRAAGGITEDADLTSINRAEFLEDGEKVYIPAFEAESSGDESYANVRQKGMDSGGRVNINTADSETLQTLNGVGPATAQKIIDYRETSGRFRSVEDLKNVSGIGDKTFEKLREYIIV